MEEAKELGKVKKAWEGGYVGVAEEEIGKDKATCQSGRESSGQRERENKRNFVKIKVCLVPLLIGETEPRQRLMSLI